MTDFLQKTLKDIEARRRELAPLVEEYRQLEEAAAALQAMQALPVPWLEPRDVTNAVLYLASDEARYVTGVTFPVDAGATVK